MLELNEQLHLHQMKSTYEKKLVHSVIVDWTAEYTLKGYIAVFPIDFASSFVICMH